MPRQPSQRSLALRNSDSEDSSYGDTLEDMLSAAASSPESVAGDASPTPSPPASFNGNLQRYSYVPPNTTTSTTHSTTTTIDTTANTTTTVKTTTTTTTSPLQTTKTPSSRQRRVSSSPTVTPSSTGASSNKRKRPPVTTSPPSPPPRQPPGPPQSPRSGPTPPTPSRRRRQQASQSPSQPPSTALPLLPDCLALDLLVVFVGLNPGIRTSQTGHAYSHPTNLFWRLLHSSGCTPGRRLRPEEDQDLPRRFGLGNTNIVSRPTRDGSSLSRAEMRAGALTLEEKIGIWRPEVVCLVGKGIWEAICGAKGWRVQGAGNKFSYGWQDEDRIRFGAVREGPGEGEEGWAGAMVFVASSTSGLAAGLKPPEKEEIWRSLGEWVRRRRVERGQWLSD
ncbi:MAG: hypothetical protein M1837_000589 [Sclerophora amabilis]|nr:MAG: hypothetical protein M1837_000589 [Sclerophora amabilis]